MTAYGPVCNQLAPAPTRQRQVLADCAVSVWVLKFNLLEEIAGLWTNSSDFRPFILNYQVLPARHESCLAPLLLGGGPMICLVNYRLGESHHDSYSQESTWNVVIESTWTTKI